LATIAGTRLSAAEARVLAHGARLPKELGIRDLLLAQILVVVVPEFFGTAVKAGPAHVSPWLLAFLLFFIPQAFVVGYLNRRMPLEGGLYEWARIGFGDWAGFLVAWNLWLTCTVQVSQIALITATYLSYAAGPETQWIASSQKILLVLSLGLIALMMWVARTGMRLGKWVSNAGSVFTVLIIAVLAALPFVLLWRGTLGEYHPARLVLPPLTLFSLSVFAKMTFGALSGFDTIAIFAGESRSPARNIARATLMATPIIALLYIAGTSSILAFVAPENVDIIGPIPQALALGLGAFGGTGLVAPIAILLLLTNYVCTYVLLFSANARLPMVAGWDRLLPTWFTRLHAHYQTPVNSILFMGGVALALSMAVLLGVGNQEAFLMLQIWTWTFYALAYLAMFLLPLISRKELGLRPGFWLRLASACGFLVTLLFVVLSIFPIISVTSVTAYTLKTVSVVVGANVFAVVLYVLSRRNARAGI
jgi:glutamate:GABA antiporter